MSTGCFPISKKLIKTFAFYFITGVCIGANAAVISIITQWLSDIKMGFCFDAWWLNQQFCCWEIEGEEVDGCDSWHSWSHVTLARWIIFVTFAVRFLLLHKLCCVNLLQWTELLIIIHGRPCSPSLRPIWSVLLRNTLQDQAFRKLNPSLLDSLCKASLDLLPSLLRV